MFMEDGQQPPQEPAAAAPPPPLPNINIPYLFSTPSFHESSIDPSLLNQPVQNPQIVPHDFDWAAILSSTTSSIHNNIIGGSEDYDHQQITKPISPSLQPLAPSMNIMSELGNSNYINRVHKVGRVGKSKKYVPPRIAFHTRSSEDILDDGYKWRKYGQKAVKNSAHPRSYYRCTHHTCNVKKQIQRLSKDTSVVVTTYEGIHNHPCEKLMETLSPLLKQLQFLSRF
ncbi:OLC1v1029864C1 [Oldenlandia corymbosa var. corymbosa]|uniref:OLC1v1029864C1 n=1 Tax=Oldenlandia corymbosa var. corymbosa TaxID=529605 RepID=A0AAV1CI33_OLDCO|nr:OLC1v1029864C1 [Oldenlandia corymbosa var. corymbosa]